MSVDVHLVALADDAELGRDRDPAGPGLPPGQGAGDEPLVMAAAVAHRSVEHGDAQVQGAHDGGDRLGVLRWPVPLGEAHAAEADGRTGKSGAAESALFHPFSIGRISS